MRVMVIIKATKDSEAQQMPSTELLTAMGNYNEELVKAGIMLDGAGLHPSSKWARVHFSGSERMVIDGPFAETKELIAGYWMWRVKSMEEAIAWVKRCPNPMNEESVVEIAPVFEAEDFGENFTPELREQEAAIFATARGLETPRFQNAPEMIVAGSNRSYTAESRGAIPQQWVEFVPQAEALPGRAGSDFYGVCWNTKPNGAFDYLTGVEISNAEKLPPQFTSLTLAARRYVVFPHAGHVSTLDKTIDTIWTKWATDCGLKVAKAPCFERYTPEFNPGTGMGGMEIWIPLDS